LWAADILGLEVLKVDRLEQLRGLKSVLRTPCIPVAVIPSSGKKRAVVQRRRQRIDSAIMKSADWPTCSMDT
jgi:hypothetical protein